GAGARRSDRRARRERAERAEGDPPHRDNDTPVGNGDQRCTCIPPARLSSQECRRTREPSHRIRRNARGDGQNGMTEDLASVWTGPAVKEESSWESLLPSFS